MVMEGRPYGPSRRTSKSLLGRAACMLLRPPLGLDTSWNVVLFLPAGLKGDRAPSVAGDCTTGLDVASGGN